MSRPRLYHDEAGTVLETSPDGTPLRFVLVLRGPKVTTSWLCIRRAGAGGYRVRTVGKRNAIDRITWRRHWRAAHDRVAVLAHLIARQLPLPFEPMQSASGGEACTNETGPQGRSHYGSQT